MRKILFVINYYPVSSETFIKDEIEYFHDSGFDVSVLCHSFKDTIPGVKFYQTGLGKSFVNRLNIFFRSILRYKNISARLKLLNFFKYKENSINLALSLVGDHFLKNKYDIIYSHFGTNGKIICQLKESGIISSDTKVIVHFHGLDLSTRTYDIHYYGILKQQADKIIVGSNLAIKQLTELGIYLENKVHKVPVSLELTKFPEKEHKQKNNEILRIATVGRLIEWKGHLDAIEVIKKFKSIYNKPFHYSIIGRGPLLETLKSKIEQYNLENEVSLLGALDHNSIIDILYETDLYLYCGKVDKDGRQEMQGLAVVEAMASSCVMVSSLVGGVQEYLNQSNALLCSPGDVECFVNNLCQAANNKELAEVLIANSRKTAVEDFDREKNYKNLINFISS